MGRISATIDSLHIEIQGYYDLLFTGQFAVTKQQAQLIQQFQEVSNIACRICNYSYHGMRFGNMPVRSFLPIHIAEYMTQLSGSSKSLISINQIILKSLFSTAYDNGLIPLEITRKFPKVTGTYTGHRALERWEISFITSNYHLHRAGLGIMLMLWAGLRKGEAAALCWQDVDFEHNVLHITKSLDYRCGVTKGTKTDTGVRDVPIFGKLREALLKERKPFGPIFTSATGETHTESSLERAIEGFLRCMERAINGFQNLGETNGFRRDVWKKRFAAEGREWKTFHFTPHDLRTTFATMCYDAGVDMHTTKNWMGAQRYRDNASHLYETF